MAFLLMILSAGFLSIQAFPTKDLEVVGGCLHAVTDLLKSNNLSYIMAVCSRDNNFNRDTFAAAIIEKVLEMEADPGENDIQMLTQRGFLLLPEELQAAYNNTKLCAAQAVGYVDESGEVNVSPLMNIIQQKVQNEEDLQEIEDMMLKCAQDTLPWEFFTCIMVSCMQDNALRFAGEPVETDVELIGGGE